MTTFNISLGSKVPGGITVELDMSNQAAIAYLIEYGIKQSLNDAIAAIKVDAPDYTVETTKALVEKRWNAILTGTVRQPGTREASDPYAAETRRVALETFKAADAQKIKAAMTKLMQSGLDEKEAKAHIVGLYAKDPMVVETARKRVDAKRAETATMASAIDLSDLGL